MYNFTLPGADENVSQEVEQPDGVPPERVEEIPQEVIELGERVVEVRGVARVHETPIADMRVDLDNYTLFGQDRVEAHQWEEVTILNEGSDFCVDGLRRHCGGSKTYSRLTFLEKGFVLRAYYLKFKVSQNSFFIIQGTNNNNNNPGVHALCTRIYLM